MDSFTQPFAELSMITLWLMVAFSMGAAAGFGLFAALQMAREAGRP